MHAPPTITIPRAAYKTVEYLDNAGRVLDEFFARRGLLAEWRFTHTGDAIISGILPD